MLGFTRCKICKKVVWPWQSRPVHYGGCHASCDLEEYAEIMFDGAIRGEKKADEIVQAIAKQLAQLTMDHAPPEKIARRVKPLYDILFALVSHNEHWVDQRVRVRAATGYTAQMTRMVGALCAEHQERFKNETQQQGSGASGSVSLPGDRACETVHASHEAG